MFKLLHYFGQFQAMRGQLIRLPVFARVLIFIAALPGVLLISLSLLALLVSILALLLLTVPLYRVLKVLVGQSAPQEPPAAAMPDIFGLNPEPDMPSPGRRKVDVTIIE
jgi:hypothetical protein